MSIRNNAVLQHFGAGHIPHQQLRLFPRQHGDNLRGQSGGNKPRVIAVSGRQRKPAASTRGVGIYAAAPVKGDKRRRFPFIPAVYPRLGKDERTPAAAHIKHKDVIPLHGKRTQPLSQAVRALVLNTLRTRFFAVGKDNADIMRVPFMQQRFRKQQQLYAGSGIIVCTRTAGGTVIVRYQRFHLKTGIVCGLPICNNDVGFILKCNGTVGNILRGQPRRDTGAAVCRRF